MADQLTSSDVGAGARNKINAAIILLNNLLAQYGTLNTAVTARALQADLVELSEDVAGRASQAAVDALSQAVGARATTASVNALSGTVSALATTVADKAGQQQVNDLAAALAGKASQASLVSLGMTVAGKASLRQVADLLASLQALTQTVGTKAPQAALDAALARFARINAGLYPSERPGDNPTAFTSVAPIGDHDALAPLSVTDYPVRVVGDGLGVEVSGSREVWTRRLLAAETGRLWRPRWRLTRTQNAQDPDGDAVERLIAWYRPDRTLLTIARVGWETPLVTQGSREFAGFIGDPGATGVDPAFARPPGALYFRLGIKAYGNEARTVLTDLGADDVSDVRDAVLALVPEDSIPALGARINELVGDVAEVVLRLNGLDETQSGLLPRLTALEALTRLIEGVAQGFAVTDPAGNRLLQVEPRRLRTPTNDVLLHESIRCESVPTDRQGNRVEPRPAKLRATRRSGHYFTQSDGATYFGVTPRRILHPAFQDLHGNAPAYANCNPRTLRKWRALAADLMSGGTTSYRLVLVGDSTTAGVGAGNPAGTGGALWSASRERCLAVYLRNILSAAGIPVMDESFWGDANSTTDGNATLKDYDPRITMGAGWATARGVPIYTAGGKLIASSSTNPFSFKPRADTDTFELWYRTNPGDGSFTVDAGGAALTTVNCDAAAGLRSVTVTAPRGANTYSVRPTSNTPVYLCGGLASDSTYPCLHLCSMGWGGSTAVSWADTANPWAPRNFLAAFPFDVAISNLGINDRQADFNNVGFTKAIFEEYYARLIKTLRRDGNNDVLLLGPLPSNTDFTVVAPASIQADYTAITKQLALRYGCGLVDMSRRMMDWRAASDLQMTSDALHYNRAGYCDAARAISQSLLNT